MLLRVKEGEKTDWFTVSAPKKTNNGKAASNQVKCPHISAALKTKKLYLTLDDENGIGTIDEIAAVILADTGWTLGICDTFYEGDGETEKIRSLSSSGKRGAYQLIQDLCDLFNARPVFNGDTKTVDLYNIATKLPATEMYIGKNLNSISVDYNSDNIVTRLYVEGEYGEHGYVGIDDVNPTGLNYLLNFDYYRNIGLFTAEHEAALAEYLENMPAAKAAVSEKMEEILADQDTLNTLWGQIDYVIYKIQSG